MSDTLRTIPPVWWANCGPTRGTLATGCPASLPFPRTAATVVPTREQERPRVEVAPPQNRSEVGLAFPTCGETTRHVPDRVIRMLVPWSTRVNTNTVMKTTLTMKSLDSKLSALEMIVQAQAAVIARLTGDLDASGNKKTVAVVASPQQVYLKQGYRHTAEEGIDFCRRLIAGEEVPIPTRSYERKVFGSMARYAERQSKIDTDFRVDKTDTRWILTWIHGRRHDIDRCLMQIVAIKGMVTGTVLKWHNCEGGGQPAKPSNPEPVNPLGVKPGKLEVF